MKNVTKETGDRVLKTVDSFLNALSNRAKCVNIIDLGHVRIAEISGPLGHHEAALRHRIFREVMPASGLSLDLTCEGDFNPISGYNGLKWLRQKDSSFTALFAASDRTV